MKKRLIKGLFVMMAIFMVSGCFKRDNMEDIDIYTTVYPIEYIVKTLYGASSNVNSVYHSGVDVSNYELTDKQVSDYSKSDLFVYNGLSEEKQIARKFVNENKNLKIIDVSYGLNIEYGNNEYEELWLSPNNFLMLATTVKNNLSDFISSKYINEEIAKNYDKLQEDVSLIDANLRSIGSAAAAKNKNTLVVSSNMFRFLENYGFNIISIEDDSNYTNEIKNGFKSGTYKYLFIKNNEENDKIKELVDSYGAKSISVNTMNVLSEETRKSGDDYVSLMKDFLNNLSDVTIS